MRCSAASSARTLQNRGSASPRSFTASGSRRIFEAYGVDAREARGMVEFALGGARGKNFVNPTPRLDESIA
jgi:hypothetical protein